MGRRGVVVRMRGDRLPGMSALGVACWGVSIWAVLGIVWWAVGDLIVGATVTGVYTVGLLGWIWSVHRCRHVWERVYQEYGTGRGPVDVVYCRDCGAMRAAK